MEVWHNKSTKLEALREFGVKQLIDGKTFTASGAQAFVDRYYKEQSWFNLIEISKAKKTYKVDGNLVNTKYVKVMADRLLDFFGLEAKSPLSKARSGVCIADEKFWSLRDFLIATVPFTMIGNLIINHL
ncbi:MAG: hypothetical protein AAFX80_00070 [Cyanobacteria bacterium J06639_18]